MENPGGTSAPSNSMREEGIVGIAVGRSVSAGGDVGAVVDNIGAAVGKLVAENAGVAIGWQAVITNTTKFKSQRTGLA